MLAAGASTACIISLTSVIAYQYSVLRETRKKLDSFHKQDQSAKEEERKLQEKCKNLLSVVTELEGALDDEKQNNIGHQEHRDTSEVLHSSLQEEISQTEQKNKKLELSLQTHKKETKSMKEQLKMSELLHSDRIQVLVQEHKSSQEETRVAKQQNKQLHLLIKELEKQLKSEKTSSTEKEKEVVHQAELIERLERTLKENGLKVIPNAAEIETEHKKMITTRNYILKEIHTTEKNYVDVLNTLYSGFIVPLNQAVSDGCPILSSKEIRAIFSSISVIRGLNQLFLERIGNRLERWEETDCVGDIFLEICVWLKSYSSYINNYDNASQALKEAQLNNDSFCLFLSNPNTKKILKRQDLSSFLIAPVQRLPRYVLLIRELVKNTPVNHLDYKDLQEAQKQILLLADTVNQSKLKYETQERLFQCAARFKNGVPIIVAANRCFVSETVFYRTEASITASPPVWKDIHILILFSDILVHARPLENYVIPSARSILTRCNSANMKQITQGPVSVDLELKKSYKLSNIDFGIYPEKLGLKFKHANGSTLMKLFATSEAEKSIFMVAFDDAKKLTVNTK